MNSQNGDASVRNILVVEVSPRGKTSASRAVSGLLGDRLEARFPGAKIVRRDLAEQPLPHLDDSTVRAIFTNPPDASAMAAELVQRSDQLIDELLACDLLVISTPMWNFGIPAALKAWIDLVVRPGKTFQYSGNGVTGLLEGRRAIMVLSSGGVFSSGPWSSWDFAAPYLRQILGFIGVTNVQSIRVEGLNVPDLAEMAIPNAISAIAALEI